MLDKIYVNNKRERTAKVREKCKASWRDWRSSMSKIKLNIRVKLSIRECLSLNELTNFYFENWINPYFRIFRQDESEIINTTDNDNKYSLRLRSDSNQQAIFESRKTTVKKVQGRSVVV